MFAPAPRHRMRLPSLRFLRPKPAVVAPAQRARAKAAPPADDNAVATARTAARRRLVGALVLLLIGIVGFPVLFETQPRPLPLDIPIAVPLRDLPDDAAAAPAAQRKPLPVPSLPADAGAEAAVTPAVLAAPATVVAAPEPAPATAPVTAPVAVAPLPMPAPLPTLVPAPAPAPATTAAPPALRPAAPQARPGDEARARALLEGAATTAAPTASAPGRFVVQVGAFTDASTLRDARAKVEKLGLKTYTQVIENDAGKRTRVRVGPFPTREEADAAATKLKGSGLPANVLTL